MSDDRFRMLISLRKNFLFVHIPKTAGSSLRHILQPYALPRNRTFPRRISSLLPFQESVENAYFRSHIKACDFRRKLGPELFSQLHKFATVRNPYDHMVSYYRFLQTREKSSRRQEKQRWSFSDAVSYFEKKDRSRTVNQTSWLVDNNGDFIVDRILFFETFAQDVKLLCRDIDLDEVHLPHENSSPRGDYRNYYNDDLKRRVENLYQADFENFGYEFDTSAPTKNPLKSA